MGHPQLSSLPGAPPLYPGGVCLLLEACCPPRTPCVQGTGWLQMALSLPCGSLLAQGKAEHRLPLTDPGGAGLFIPETALLLSPQQLMGLPSALYILAEAGYPLPAPAPSKSAEPLDKLAVAGTSSESARPRRCWTALRVRQGDCADHCSVHRPSSKF